LKEDSGYAAAIENTEEEMVSSHQIKRFFKSLWMAERWHIPKGTQADVHMAVKDGETSGNKSDA